VVSIGDWRAVSTIRWPALINRVKRFDDEATEVIDNGEVSDDEDQMKRFSSLYPSLATSLLRAILITKGQQHCSFNEEASSMNGFRYFGSAENLAQAKSIL